MAGIVLGLLLGDIGEAAFVKTMQLTNYNPVALMQRPICGVLITIGILTLVWNIVRETVRALSRRQATA